MTARIPDWSGAAGAEKLARRLEAYWRALGAGHVVCTVERTFGLGGKGASGGSIFGVRSNLVNGEPPRTAEWPPPANPGT